MLKIQAHGRQEIIDIKNKKPWSMHVNIYIKKQYFTNLFYVVTYKFHDLWVNSLKRSQGQLSKKVLSLYIHTNKSLDRLYQSNVSIWKFCHRSLFVIWKTNLGYETNSLYEPRTTERQTDRSIPLDFFNTCILKIMLNNTQMMSLQGSLPALESAVYVEKSGERVKDFSCYFYLVP